MPVQLKTLLPLFAIFLILFFIVRSFLIPESFGDIGHYRANYIDEIAAHETNYAGKAACKECHEDIFELLESDLHAGLTCEVCHGPGSKHILEMDNMELIHKPLEREYCLICHFPNPAKNSDLIKQIKNEEHYPEKNRCIDCHNPHAVWTLKE